jgi:hypothetical protein
MGKNSMAANVDLNSIINSKTKSNSHPIKIIHDYFILALECIKENHDVLKVRLTKTDPDSNVDYGLVSKIITRTRINDRVFPVETISLKKHESEHTEILQNAVIHTGSYADELARSFHALAITVGRDIFFRHGKYKPETEEGRVLLAHELKHVSQIEENPSEDNRTKEQLEQEAKIEEQKEIYDPQMYIELGYNNKKYKVKKEIYQKLKRNSEKELERWVEEQEYCMSPEDYLELLCNYEKYLEKNKYEL